jgi:hypothetical protein
MGKVRCAVSHSNCCDVHVPIPARSIGKRSANGKLNHLLFRPNIMPASSSTVRSNAQIPSSLLVSLAATPCLMTIIALQTATELLKRLGVASEEVFRGDRLPVLHFPDHPAPTQIVED